MELFILFGGAYALYTVGMAIATELDYREFNRQELRELRQKNDEILSTLKAVSYTHLTLPTKRIV